MQRKEDPKTTGRNIATCVVLLLVFIVCFCLPAVGVPVYSLIGTQSPKTTEYVYPTRKPVPAYNTAIPQSTPIIYQYIEPNVTQEPTMNSTELKKLEMTAIAIITENNPRNHLFVSIYSRYKATQASVNCPEGCGFHAAWCDIKGNISFDTKEKIYHLPGDYFYNEVKISPEYGERWFCTEEDAIRNGWRHSTQ